MTIEMKNVGAIEKLSIPVPEEGGVVVLRGGQGAGKSTGLRAISKVLGGSTRELSPRDGTTRGEVWFDGAKLTVTRGRQAVKGELEVESLEGRFDISKLVDPGIQDPVSADSARIKALIALSGATAGPDAFYEACGGKKAFDELGVDADTSDPITLAGRISRALQAKARTLEKQATSGFADAKAKQDSVAGIDLKTDHDRETLQKAYDSARDNLTKLDERQAQYESQQKSISEAKQGLETAKEADVPTVDQAKNEERQKFHSKDVATKRVAELEAQLATAKEALRDATAAQEHAVELVRLAESHEKTVASLQATIEAATVSPVSQEQIAEAKDAVTAAQDAVEAGAKIRDAQKVTEQAQQDRLKAEDAQENAEKLRKQSHAVDAVLSELIPSGNLRIDEGRLVTTTERSASELFAELSDGERAAMAVEIAAANLSPQGLVIAPQYMWEGWTESTRQMVRDKCREKRVVLATAEARDGELIAEVYE